MQNPSAHENTDLQPQPPPEEQNYGATATHVRQGTFVSVSRNDPAKRDYLIAAVLCYANLINFMDWFIVPGESLFSSSKEKRNLSSQQLYLLSSYKCFLK